jgi:transposase
MSRQRITMKKLKEVGQSVNISPATVSEYLNLFKVLDVLWAEVCHLNDEALEKLIYRHSSSTKINRPKPDWDKIHLELKRKGNTLLLLWQEYRNQHANWHGASFLKIQSEYT